MKAGRFSAITIALDTERFRVRRPDEKERIIGSLLGRLLGGEEVAERELEHYGLKVTARPAVKPEILK